MQREQEVIRLTFRAPRRLNESVRGRGAALLRDLAAALILSLSISIASTAADESVGLRPLESWTTEFSGRDVVRHFRAESGKRWDGRVVWSLTSADRTVGRGEQFVQIAQDSSVEIRVAFRVEKLREGVELPFQLKVELIDQKTSSASNALTLWFLQEQPFAGRGNWLNQLKIALFDPSGKTADVFRQSAIPFSPIRNSAALQQLNQGVLILGEGISFKEHRGVVADALAAAARGILVICLAPKDGDFPLHTIDATESAELRFQGVGMIRKLDKRLDSSAWPPSGQIPRSGIQLPEKRELVHVDSTGWPWMQAQFNSGGSFIFCGFSLIEAWEATPTPRYLLLRILEKFALVED